MLYLNRLKTTQYNTPDITSLLETGISFVACREAKDNNSLFKDEFKYITNAVNKRKLDFTTGRWCARKAMSQLGIKPQPILIGSHREPIWPNNIVGSISHTTNYYCAVVSKKVKSIGIDAEKIDYNLDLRTYGSIFSKQEKKQFKLQTTEQQKYEAYIIFSAKESIFKSMFPLVKKYFDFSDVNIEINWVNFTFEGTLLIDLDETYIQGIKLNGKYWLFNKIVLTIIIIN